MTLVQNMSNLNNLFNVSLAIAIAIFIVSMMWLATTGEEHFDYIMLIESLFK